MLEKSTVSKQDIRFLLSERYALHKVDNIIPLKGGSANCYRIQAVHGEFVLKELQSEYTVADVRMEPEINEFLRARGIPTAQFIPTRTGEYVWQYRNRAFHLQEYVSGAIFPSNGAPDWLMRESVSLLGKLHQVFTDFPLMREGIGTQWFSAWNVDASRHQYSILIEAAEHLPQGSRREQILRDLRYKVGLLSKVAQIRIDFGRLTRRNSHGDYSLLQLVCGSSSVHAIIDFSSACVMPVIREIIRSYTYGDPKCFDAQIDVQNLKSYVLLYLKHVELSRYDLKMMPYLYLLQIARGRYGYKEYLISKSENRGSLIQFGFWRTNMCRWLEEHAESLSRELADLAK